MADPHADLIRQAVLQARDGHPQEALDSLLGNPAPDSSASASLYHFTVGSLFLRQNQPGKALAHLDASLHRGGARPAGELRDRARTMAEQKLGEGSLDRASLPLEQGVDHPLYLPLEGILAVLAATAAVRCLRRGTSPGVRRTALRRAAILWLLALAGATGHYWGARFPRARASGTLVLRSGPAEDFLQLGRVDAGAELRVLSEDHGWMRVRVSPDTSGWIPSSGVLLLKPPSTTPEP